MDRNAFAMLCDLLKSCGRLLDDGVQDGTYIEVNEHESDKPRYGTRKGHIATNVLGACTHDLKFVYVLSCWEGSTIDSRILRDAIIIHNRLKVSFGKFDMSDRHNWTLEKEDVMISILERIEVDSGRRDTSSFRSGTYKQIASKILEKIEKITIKAKHVQNKMKRLKDKYSAAYDMLNTNGFSWDDTRKFVTVNNPEILEEYLNPRLRGSSLLDLLLQIIVVLLIHRPKEQIQQHD
ncbi:hypothetical protein Ddye_012925 [Dipteronia dyeriana]|uniref:Myb/SANT-like domain-containing protein n=1 Tax=Dipteronia dyeriana TaxID=168575 RepID=A0AAD9X5C3_9ROSI|nr:hypothetical protein Ddye_012925 [Dipteronia dyeriana]